MNDTSTLSAVCRNISFGVINLRLLRSGAAAVLHPHYPWAIINFGGYMLHINYFWIGVTIVLVYAIRRAPVFVY